MYAEGHVLPHATLNLLKIYVYQKKPFGTYSQTTFGNKALMRLTHASFWSLAILLPVAAAVLPSEILLVAKLFTTGSSICLPGITSTFTEASNLIALLQLSK